MEAWWNERQSCEDTEHTSTTHKDMSDNQEAKMADSRDTQWMVKPFTTDIYFCKERICSTEQSDVLYPWPQKNPLISCFCYFPHWHKTHFSNPRKANARASLWKATFLFPPEVSIHLVAGDQWTSAISKTSFQSFLLAKTVTLVVLYSKSGSRRNKTHNNSQNHINRKAYGRRMRRAELLVILSDKIT